MNSECDGHLKRAGTRHGRAVRRWIRTWACVSACLAAAGCREPDSPEEAQRRYTPAIDRAEGAVRSALEGWKAMDRPESGTIELPGVMFVDLTRGAGQRLVSFEIIRTARLDNAVQVTVRLRLSPAKGKNPAIAKYNVFGIDPLWVYRLEDYEMISHWNHEMATAKKAAEPGTAKGAGSAGASH